MAERIPPSACSADATRNGVWIAIGIYLICLVAWIWVARAVEVWVVGGILAALFGIVVLSDLRAWRRGRILSRFLGPAALEIEHHPVTLGEAIEVRLEIPISSLPPIEGAFLALISESQRQETWGSASRSKSWRTVHRDQVEAFATRSGGETHLRDVINITVPADPPPSGDGQRWWLYLKITLDGLPDYTADFALEVIAD
jgi:hypothetical protein